MAKTHPLFFSVLHSSLSIAAPLCFIQIEADKVTYDEATSKCNYYACSNYDQKQSDAADQRTHVK